MPAGSKWTIYGGQIIYMSKKPWTSGKNTLIFNIFQYHSHFIDVPENTGFMGFYSISCLQNMQYAGLSVVIPVESRKSKRKLDTRTLIPSAESRILFQICVTFFFLCITAVQLLPTVTTLCVYRFQCWKSRSFLTIFVPGSARVCSNTNLHTSGISGKREWRNLGLKGPWWPLIFQDLTQTFPLKQSFMTQSSTPAMRWQNQPTTSKYSSYSFFSVRFHGEFPANRKHIYNHIIYMTMSYVTTICKQRYLFPFWGLLGTKIYDACAMKSGITRWNRAWL